MTRIIILAALTVSFIIGFADGITGFMMVAALGTGFMSGTVRPRRAARCRHFDFRVLDGCLRQCAVRWNQARGNIPARGGLYG